MPGSGNAVSLAPTCVKEEESVNQAEHLDAQVANAPQRRCGDLTPGESRASTRAAASVTAKPDSLNVGYASNAGRQKTRWIGFSLAPLAQHHWPEAPT
jgi:hypothetical protein